MKVAIVGSRDLSISDLGTYLPEHTTELVSGGARGIDACAKKYALENGLKWTEFLPEYERYGRSAPLRRNLQIINYADMVIAFWDGVSRGTSHVIKQCLQEHKKLKVYTQERPGSWTLALM